MILKELWKKFIEKLIKDGEKMKEVWMILLLLFYFWNNFFINIKHKYKKTILIFCKTQNEKGKNFYNQLNNNNSKSSNQYLIAIK